MTEESKAKPAKGSIAKVSGGQPELDVDALMNSVNAHNEASVPVESPAETAVVEPTAEHRKSKSNNT